MDSVLPSPSLSTSDFPPFGRLIMRKILCSASMIAVVASGLTRVRGDEPLDFGRDIRPILSDKCFACHGPDEADRSGGFRLDLKESAFGEADSGERPIVPGNVEASEVVRRITSDDEYLRMPPADSHKSLKAEEIEKIRRWIAEGAAWKEHWSLIAPTRPELPSVKQEAWPRNEIDRFILARLEREKLAPARVADKATLLRRVTLDLTGLPPTPEELEAFLQDDSREAYEKVVDRLLASPRYGEHMARYWLDVARYGDTHGMHLDNYREMWPYRDWVVQSFNRNQPFDRFTIEQLAGDLLPNPTDEQMIATGFNRCHVTTNEGGSIAEEVEVRNVVDRVVTTGTVFMGLTFDCTRCHDHKYDPLTMKDFYSFYAYFNSLDGNPLDENREDPAPVIKAPSPEQKEQLASLAKEIAGIEAKLTGPWPEVDAAQTAWEERCRQDVAAEEEVEDDKFSVAAVEKQADGGRESFGQLTVGDWYWVGPFGNDRRYLRSRKQGPEGKKVVLEDTFKLPTGEQVGWVRKPEWVDGSIHTDLPGELVANFLTRTISTEKAQKITLSLGSDDAIRVYLNNRQVFNKNVERPVAADQDSVELTLKPGKNQLLVKITNYQGGAGFYFKITSPQKIIPGGIFDLARIPVNQRTTEDQKRLRDFYRNNLSDSKELKAAQQELNTKRDARMAVEREVPTTLVWREKAEPVQSHLLNRGEYDQVGDPVPRQTPSFLPPMSEELPNNRLGLAKWLLDASHPLTARVNVNRFWQQVFGTGLVKTSEDFGSQGEPPSHPELLDWLAVDFRENGWDVKRLMKQMVMSATYQQSSRVTPELWQRDPGNRLLARGPRARMQAEMIRDQALFTSGLLVEKMGGPSVKPPQPGGLWEAVGYSGSNTVKFKADTGHEMVHRRSLYTFIKRTAPPPQMNALDAPSREVCIMRRERTNTPLQALLLMNDTQFFEAAVALADRTLEEGGSSSEQRAEWMLRECLCRQPQPAEIETLSKGVIEDLEHYRAHPKAAEQVIKVGEFVPETSLDQAELAAWTMAANTVLNLDEFLNKN